MSWKSRWRRERKRRKIQDMFLCFLTKLILKNWRDFYPPWISKQCHKSTLNYSLFVTANTTNATKSMDFVCMIYIRGVLARLKGNKRKTSWNLTSFVVDQQKSLLNMFNADFEFLEYWKDDQRRVTKSLGMYPILFSLMAFHQPTLSPILSMTASTSPLRNDSMFDSFWSGVKS